MRAQLVTAGVPINHADLLIASIAVSHEATLVTGHVVRLARVPGLEVEDWLKEP